MNELDQYIEQLDGLIRQLSPEQQHTLSRQIGVKIRQNVKQRIKSNIAPSGEAFVARQGIATRPFSGSLKKEQNFVYNGKIQRYRTLRDDGAHYIGWNYRTHHTFKALKDRIRLPERGLRQKLMFKKLNQFKYLKLKATSHEAAIGFLSGLTGYIAAAHQYGEGNRPERQLLGFSDDDMMLIKQMLLDYFARK